MARLSLPETGTEQPRRPREFGQWEHYSWKLPEDFDDPDLEIEEMFYGDGTV